MSLPSNFVSTPTSASQVPVLMPAKTGPTICKYPQLFDYMTSVSLRPSPTKIALNKEVAVHPVGVMSSTPDESQFLAFLAKLIGAKKVIEVGVFLGATTLTIAEALPADGKIVALDVSEEFTSIGKKYWEAAGVASKIDLRLAPALDSLKNLADDPKEVGTYDLAFIDADKPNYDSYYEYCLKLLRVGGVIAVDNVFWQGLVIDDTSQRDDTNAVRAINKKILGDSRVDISMLCIADGVTLCRKV